MNKKRLQQFGLFVFLGLLIWTATASRVTRVLLPEADTLQLYLIDKALFAGLLLAVMHKAGGLKLFGMEFGSNWWSLAPALPILLLSAAVFFAPGASFGLGVVGTAGWISVAIFVGVGEECVFRGVLWKAFEQRGILVASFVTSALFGAVHLMGFLTDIPWQIIASQAVFAFGAGMMFAAVRFVSGSLLVPIVLHALFDAAAIVAAGGLNEMFDETLSVEKLLIPGALFAVWGLVSILIASKWRSKSPLQSTAGEVRPIIDA